jgi:hypothetical protein
MKNRFFLKLILTLLIHQEKYPSQLFLGILLPLESGLATSLHLLSIVGTILPLSEFPNWLNSMQKVIITQTVLLIWCYLIE